MSDRELIHSSGKDFKKKVGEVGPLNWQEGVMCYIVGWKTYSNSKWEKTHQGYRPDVERRFNALKDSLNLPQTINSFMKHLLITLLISTIAFIVAIVLQNDEGIMITSGIFVLWSIVYIIWSMILLREMRSKIRKGFLEIEVSLPELQFKFSELCEGCCSCCIRQDYI
jgi:hypothetical protein